MSSIYPVSTPDLADGEIPIGASAVSASRPPIKRIAHLRRLLRRGIQSGLCPVGVISDQADIAR
jgi:hypothetical protein